LAEDERKAADELMLIILFPQLSLFLPRSAGLIN
jgi:hypothetical protein